MARRRARAHGPPGRTRGPGRHHRIGARPNRRVQRGGDREAGQQAVEDGRVMSATPGRVPWRDRTRAGRRARCGSGARRAGGRYICAMLACALNVPPCFASLRPRQEADWSAARMSWIIGTDCATRRRRTLQATSFSSPIFYDEKLIKTTMASALPGPMGDDPEFVAEIARVEAEVGPLSAAVIEARW